jgi:phenylalanyl-tRNA synthetase beta chain
MKIPYNWIREFVELSLSPEEAADRLVNAGIEVASVTRVAPTGLSGVLVGEIEAIERELGESQGHRLVLCRVSIGRESFSVVCGAPNAAVGVRAAFAPPGATLPGTAEGEIRRVAVARIRGVESQGMLCSERELGIGDEHERGIFTLTPDAPLSADLVAQLGLDDSVLDVEITPNRPDCLSVVGVARELAALTGAPLRVPEIAVKESGDPVSDLARVRIEAPDLCARYTVRVVSDVRVGPSPAWMAARLRAVGLRPISNVVDVTNYVLWELGHPLHAFDHAAVREATIVVRRARAGERFRTLDGQDRQLADSMCVIADPERSIGLAGVMGGANTEVSDSTTRVLLESAWFDPATTRRTARTLGLRTDAAYRFERGADIEALVAANDRAAQLIAELAGGSVARGLLDVYPRPRPRPRVRLRMSRVERVLGIAPPRPEARRILVGLGLSVEDRGKDLEVEVPSFRRDLAVEDDLVEEIIRVWGYDKIPSTLEPTTVQLVERPERLRQADAVRRALAAAGLSEAVGWTFTDQPHAAALPTTGEPLVLVNPLSQDAAFLRNHPLAGVLSAVGLNLRRQQPSVRLFEIARTYERRDGVLVEPRWATLALSGQRGEPAWYRAVENVDVYDAKGLAEHALEALGIAATAGSGGQLSGFEEDCHGTLVTASGTVVAEFGEVAARVREEFDIDLPVFAAVLSLDALETGSRTVTPPSGSLTATGNAPESVIRYEALPRYPAVQRDVAFVVDAGSEVTAARIESAMRELAGALLRGLTLFDVFRFPDGRRSLAWRLTFQAEDRTLTDEEINAIQERVARGVSERFHVTWRGA